MNVPIRGKHDAAAAVLALNLDQLDVPLHVRHTNAALLALVDAEELNFLDALNAALIRRKHEQCPGCRGEGGHVERPGADVERFTPGVAGG